MSEMVERVARALAPLAWAALGSADTLAQKNRRAASLKHARAAIEAMREPTQGMMEDAACCHFPPFASKDKEGQAQARDCWQSMIDEALR